MARYTSNVEAVVAAQGATPIDSAELARLIN
jgi:hypothetical protein